MIILAAGTAALSAGVGYLPVLGALHHLGPLTTGALVSLLAATAAVIATVGRSSRTTAAGPLPERASYTPD